MKKNRYPELSGVCLPLLAVAVLFAACSGGDGSGSGGHGGGTGAGGGHGGSGGGGGVSASGGKGGAGSGGSGGVGGIGGMGGVAGKGDSGGAAAGHAGGGGSGAVGGLGASGGSGAVGGYGTGGASGGLGGGGHLGGSAGNGGGHGGGSVGNGGRGGSGVAATGGRGGQGGGAAGAGGGNVAASCAAAPTLMEIVGANRCPSDLTALPATPSAADVWVADAAAPDGGYRLTLNLDTAVSAGGHSYRFTSGDTLFGTGLSSGASMAIIGSLALSVDGQTNQIKFDFGGCADQRTTPGSVVARVSSMRGGMSQTVERTYTLTSPGGGVSYKLSSPQAPAGCTTGVDLMGITF